MSRSESCRPHEGIKQKLQASKGFNLVFQILSAQQMQIRRANRKVSWRLCVCMCVPAGEVCGRLCSGNIRGKLCWEDGSLHHHRPQRGHDARPAHQRRQSGGPQGHCTRTHARTNRVDIIIYRHLHGHDAPGELVEFGTSVSRKCIKPENCVRVMLHKYRCILEYVLINLNIR